LARELPADLSAAWSSIPLTPEEVLELERAARHEFRAPVTAYLTSVSFVRGHCLGVVWCDDRGGPVARDFTDGHRLHTSQVITIERDGDFPVIVTLNSRYVVISLLARRTHGATVH
jgi:hypothetical protein